MAAFHLAVFAPHNERQRLQHIRQSCSHSHKPAVDVLVYVYHPARRLSERFHKLGKAEQRDLVFLLQDLVNISAIFTNRKMHVMITALIY